MPRPSIAQKRQAFRQLHQAGCFVIPNPWDVGSAVALADQGRFDGLAGAASGARLNQLFG